MTAALAAVLAVAMAGTTVFAAAPAGYGTADAAKADTAQVSASAEADAGDAGVNTYSEEDGSASAAPDGEDAEDAGMSAYSAKDTDATTGEGPAPEVGEQAGVANDADGGVLKSWDFEVKAPEEPVYDGDGNEVWTWTMPDLDTYFTAEEKRFNTASSIRGSIWMYTARRTRATSTRSIPTPSRRTRSLITIRNILSARTAAWT